MPVSLEQFQQQLADSSLMAADEVAAMIDGLPADKRPQNAEQLARELVRQKKLTAYQAQQLYAGKGRSLVLGNYVILDKLGQGGMGLVLKAEHRRMKRLVALKVLSPKVVRNPDSLRRFQREVEAAARLEHPNIVTAHDADEAGGTHFLVMQYVDGSDLSVQVRQQGVLPLDQALDCILQASRGLQYAHEHGVVHRDIKPANLLLDRHGTVKILDMGLARLDSAGGDQDQLTGTGQIMGTVDYMAPEQATSTKHADARADIYSLGVTFWYLLTGRPMFTGESPLEKIMAHQTKPVPSLHEACPEVSLPLDAVFRRMVAKTPEERYQTMAEVIADLEPFCGRAATAAAMPSVVEDAKLDDFLRGLGTSPGSQRRGATLSKPSPAAGVATKAGPAAAAEPDVTQDWSGPHVGTDARTEQSLPGGRLPVPAPKKDHRPPRPPWWQDWKVLAAAGAGVFLLLLLGIWVIIRDKDGKEVARVQLPEGGSVTQEPAAALPVPVLEKPKQRPEPSVSKPQPLPPWNLPPGSPPPAIAPFDAAQAKAHQEAWAKHLGVEVEMENSIGMRFVLIPPGEFDMGSTEEEVAKLLEEAKATNEPSWYIDRLPSEAPRHRVRITKPFWLGVHEVTRGQFRRFVEDSGYQTEAERDGKGGYGTVDGQWKQDPRLLWNSDLSFVQTDDHPVANVTWNDVTAFCQWLSEKEGEKLHLPSEAQWEYACRAGTTTTWYSGDDEGALREHGWFLERKLHPVGQKTPNAWGLYDMHGNVREWCLDWYANDYYAASPLDDPAGPGAGSDRVFRGGGWSSIAGYCRSANRCRSTPSSRIYDLGFRLAFSSVDASGG